MDILIFGLEVFWFYIFLNGIALFFRDAATIYFVSPKRHSVSLCYTQPLLLSDYTAAEANSGKCRHHRM